MRSKLISLFIAISMILSCVLMQNVSATDNIEKSDIISKAELLHSIGIINNIVEESEGNETITRTEFVVMVANIFGIQGAEDSVRYFEDVPLNYPGAFCINRLCEMNVISIPENRLFRPYDNITEAEAVKMLVSVLGYRDYAELNGGYPTGYNKVASKLGFKSKGSLEVVTLYKAYELIYDTLNSYVYEITATRTEQVNYKESDKTLLSIYFDVYFVEGVVTQAGGVSLYSAPIVRDNYSTTSKIVVVDGVEYTSKIDLYDYLGRYAKVYYYQKNENDIPSIIHTEKCKKKEYILDVDYENYIGYENGKFSYYNEKGRRITVDIPIGAVIIVNGETANSNTIKVFNKYETGQILKKGKIRLIDTENDNKIDYVIMENYKNVFVSSVNKTSSTMFDTLNPGISISLDENKKLLCIKDIKGNLLDFSTITKGKLLTIYDSETFTKVIVNSDGITAKIIDLKQKSDEISLKLGTKEEDSVWYSIDKDYFSKFVGGSKKLSVGESLTYYLDAFGKIAYISETVGDGWQLGYLVRIVESTDDVFGDSAKMRIFMQDGTMKYLNVPEKVWVDGVKRQGYHQIYNALNKKTVQGKNSVLGDNPKNPNTKAETSVYDADEHEVFGQLIRVMINSRGEVSRIDSEFYNEGKEDENSLQRSLYRKMDAPLGYHWWWKAYSYNARKESTASAYHAGYQLFYNANTVRFVVPKYSELLTAEDDDFFILATSTYDEGKNIDVEGFKIGRELGMEAAIVKYGSVESEWSNLALVGAVEEMIDEDGAVVESAKLYLITGEEATIIAAESESFISVDTLYDKNPIKIAEGDIIQYKNNTKGEVAEINIVHDFSKWNGHTPESGQKWVVGTGVQSEDPQSACLYIKKYNDGLVYTRFATGAGGPVTVDEMSYPDKYDFAIPVLSSPAWVYDGKTITKSTVEEEIETIENVGFENTRPCYISMDVARINGAIFYKNLD